MKITIFGLTISSSWGNGHATPYRAIVRALHGMGHSVHFFERDVPYYRLRRDFHEAEYCELVLYPDWNTVRRPALQTARESDVVIAASYVPDGQLVCGEILGLNGPLRVFYDLDTPVTLAGLQRGGVDYLSVAQIPDFDLVLSFAGGPALKQLENIYGARMARPLYGCVDPDVYARVELNPEFACDLSYMGTYAPDRQAKLDEMFFEVARRRQEKQFVLAGSLYPDDWRWPANIRRFEHISPHSHAGFYSSSRLTLNVTRKEMAGNGWCPSGRFFEAAACGTPVISDWWEGLYDFFDPENEIRVAYDARDVESILDQPAEALSTMARRARERTLQEHTGQARAAQLLRYLEEARPGLPQKAATGDSAA